MSEQYSEQTMTPTSQLNDLVADLDAEQLKALLLHLFLTTKNPAFRANIKSWRKSQNLPKTV